VGKSVKIGHQPLSLQNAEAVVYQNIKAEIEPGARRRVAEAAEYIARQAQIGRPVYGVTTGFGANRDTPISPSDAEELQYNLIISHACGVGEPFSEEVVRAILLFRVNALAYGYSGIRDTTLDVLLGMLNRGVLPVIPEFGSLGASGDLCPLAHMSLPLIGLGEAIYQGERLPGAEAMERAGLKTLQLTFKEGLALLNGTQVMTALGMVAVRRFRRLLNVADGVAALSLEAVAGRSGAFDPRVQRVRGRLGQAVSAANVLSLIEGSELVDSTREEIPEKKDEVQDAYCIRCVPQVHGACRDVLAHVSAVIETEINAVTDNPIVFVDDDDIVSGGNFHGEPVAMALDYLKLAISELANISERRSAKLVDKSRNEGLSAFLACRPGLNSGYMIPHYVAAALVSECKNLTNPSSADSIPTSANMEDHVSMGAHAGRHALMMMGYGEQVLGIELLIASQAIDLRKPRRPGSGVREIVGLLREKVSFMESDRLMYPELEEALSVVCSEEMCALLGTLMPEHAGTE
jgi:histidine ammonia-lyase